MILALNIGNSHITFGSYTVDGKLVFSSRLFADPALSSDELVYKMVNMLALYGADTVAQSYLGHYYNTLYNVFSQYI